MNRRARDADELYESIRAHSALAPAALKERVRGDWRAMLAALEGQGRVIRARLDPEGAAVLAAAEDRALLAAAYEQATFEPANFDFSGATAIAPDAAREEIVRRALKTSGPVTAPELAARLRMEPARIEAALAALEASGAIFRGHFNRADAEQWCDRYVLEKIHRMTLARVRAEIEPCEDHEFAAFRLRWNHVGGADLPPGQEGAGVVLEQLSGLSFEPHLWESAILPARVPGYRPEYLDLQCLGGSVIWAGVAESGAQREFPAKVAFLARRQRLLWPAKDAEILDPKEQAVYDAILAGGAQYLDQVADRAGLSERDTLGALWRLAASGRVSNDSFAPLRMLSSDPEAKHALEPARARPVSRHDAAIRARLKSSLSGRWSTISRPERAGESDFDQASELAMILLARNGILSREMLALESIPVSWSEISFALRRLEYAGTIRRGWFVRALSGEQYALPEAVEMLRAARALNPARERPIALSAADPANPYGALLPGCGIARDAGSLVAIRAGRVVLGLTGRALIEIGELDDEAFGAALASLIAMRPRVAVETINGRPALESSRVGLMAAMRFHSDGRALVYDGLPGPAPARANRSAY